MAETKISWERALSLACLLSVTWLAWDTPFVHPVRIFVTFLHEMGHAAGAIVSGGHVDKIAVHLDGSGETLTRGGWRIVFLPAGYLGSMVFGSLMLLIATRTRFVKAANLLLGLGFVGCVAFYVHSSAGFFYGLAWGAALASAYWWLPEAGNTLLLSFLGSASCLYALFDIRTLWQINRGFETDAVLMSRYVLPLPPRVWAAWWAVLAVVCLAMTLRVSVRKA